MTSGEERGQGIGAILWDTSETIFLPGSIRQEAVYKLGIVVLPKPVAP